MKEMDDGKNPIYFVFIDLAVAKARYQKIEKVTLVVMVASQKLIKYFWVHPFITRTYLPLRHILYQLNLDRILTKWET